MAQTSTIAPTNYPSIHPAENPHEEYGGFTAINLCDFIRALEMIEAKPQ